LVIFAGPGSHFVAAALMFAAWLFFFGDVRTAPAVVDKVDATLNGGPGPAYQGGMQAGDVITGVGGVHDPTREQVTQLLTTQAREHAGDPIAVQVQRGGDTVTLHLVPQLSPVEDEVIGRVGVELAPPVPQRVGPVAAVVGGVSLVGQSVAESVRQIGHVFGPQGIGRVVRLLFTDAQRNSGDATSVVGIGQQVGATGTAHDWGTILYFLAFVTVFIGLLNLLPLPPFDGGHLFVLLIEKFRGKAIDMRKLIPVSAVVMVFFVTFVMATVILDFTKPISTTP
jgi:regulator of sigma E protease